MAGPKVLQFFILILFVIFSTNALKVFLTNGKVPGCFYYETEIKVLSDQGGRHYNGRVENGTYTAGRTTTTVIVYIKTKTLLDRTALLKNRKCICKRLELARELGENGYELLYLGVLGYYQGDERLIGEFLQQSIKPHQDQTSFQINIIDLDSNKIYETTSGNLSRYNECINVLNGRVENRILSLHE